MESNVVLPVSMPHKGPGWAFIFGLVCFLIIVGFILIFLIIKLQKQDRHIRALQHQQNLHNQKPEPISHEDVLNTIHEFNQHNPILQKTMSVMDGKLRDFDQYCRSIFIQQTQKTLTPLTAEQLHAPPPLENPNSTCAGSDTKSEVQQLQQSLPPQQSSPPTQQSSPSPTQQSSPSPTQQSSQPTQQSSQPTQQSSPPPIQSNNLLTSMLSNVISNMGGLSGLTGGGEQNSDQGITIPMLVSEFASVAMNQQTRKQERPIVQPK
jgi:hypothetical protein